MVTVFGFDRNGSFDSEFSGDGGFVYLDDYNELKCYADHMEVRIAELEKDAARYRWLRGNCQEVADCHATSAQLYFGTYGWGDLDSDIDDAMSREA